MYILNFPNGNSQTYPSQADLVQAARAMGGDAKFITGKTYVFVPKQ